MQGKPAVYGFGAIPLQYRFNNEQIVVCPRAAGAHEQGRN